MLEQTLSKYFIYDKIFNLLDYDGDMMALYHELATLKKNYYENNYRFIFCHWDTDYYLNVSGPGMTLRNLQRILVNLDIPNYFCLIITGQNIGDDLAVLRREEAANDLHPISHITTFLQDFGFNCVNESSTVTIDKVFISLNGRVRKHRTLALSLISHKQLLDNGIISYGTT
jgi:hypothetical protein